MKKVTMIEEMTTILSAMKVLLDKAGVAADKLLIPEGSAELRADFIRPGYKWLKYVYENEFAAANKVYKLLKPHQWEAYDLMLLMDSTPLPEVKRLEKVLRTLKSKVSNNKKPDFFKKGKMKNAIKRRKDSGKTGTKEKTSRKQES